MARKTKVSTIQTTVDTYASQRAKSIKLRESLHKAIDTQQEAGAALIAHVKATTSGGKVAFHAANGDTLIVTPQYGGSVDTVSPGQQELPEAPEPLTAAIGDEVRDLLANGLGAEAQKLIEQTMTNGTSAEANTAKTATQVNYEQIQARMSGYRSDLLDAMTYGLSPRLFYRPGTRYLGSCSNAPAITQETYKSATLGRIQVSRRAKALFLEERNAVVDCVTKGDYNTNNMRMSRARGEIAKYISELEQQVNALTSKLEVETQAKVYMKA